VKIAGLPRIRSSSIVTIEQIDYHERAPHKEGPTLRVRARIWRTDIKVKRGLEAREDAQAHLTLPCSHGMLKMPPRSCGQKRNV